MKLRPRPKKTLPKHAHDKHVTMPIGKAKFSEGEKVLCYHGSMLYEAKCLKIDREKELKYYVHYSGWSKLWDELVPESRVLKYNDQNLAKQQELKKTHDRSRKGTKRRVGDDFGDGSRGPSRESSRERSKRRRTKYKGHLEQDSIEPVVISIPEPLKRRLIRDADMLTGKKLVSLPASPTVSEVLDDFSDFVAKTNPASTSTGVTKECMLGLRTYFNELLPAHLLYNGEKSQYDKVMKKKSDTQGSDVYGAEHLLRLFVNIPDYVAHMVLEPEDIILLTNQLEQFLRFLEDHQGRYFTAQYSAGA